MVYTFACPIGSFNIEDWEFIERVIDFKVLEDKEHEGIYGGKAIVGSVCQIGSFDKVSYPPSAFSHCFLQVCTAAVFVLTTQQ